MSSIRNTLTFPRSNIKNLYWSNILIILHNIFNFFRNIKIRNGIFNSCSCLPFVIGLLISNGLHIQREGVLRLYKYTRWLCTLPKSKLTYQCRWLLNSTCPYFFFDLSSEIQNYIFSWHVQMTFQIQVTPLTLP